MNFHDLRALAERAPGSPPFARRRVEPPTRAHHPTPRVKTRQISPVAAKEAHL